MEYRRFGVTLVIRIDKGEEIIQSLRLAAEKEQVRLAAVQDHHRVQAHSPSGVHRERRSPQGVRSRAQVHSPDRDIRQKIFWKMKIWILWI